MSKTKILYVEDEMFLAKIVKESLESRGYEVLLEMDGGEAVARFNADPPDICVLDIMLPNKDGFSIAEEIRQVNTGVPIIFLTAKTQTTDLVKGFHTGANDYIRKPFSMEELIVRIENALRSKHNNNIAGVQKDNIAIGNYLFNPNRQTLTDASEEKKVVFQGKRIAPPAV